MKNTLKIAIFIFLTIGYFSCDKFGKSNKSKSKTKTGVEYTLNKNGDSIKISYFQNGSVKSKTTIKNKYYQGLTTVYYENGNIKYEINYDKSTKDGVTKWFYKSGKLYRETDYINGQINGVRKLYYENGNLMAEIPYKYDQLIPGTKEYSKSGKLLTDYPKITIVPVDKMALEDTYYLEVSLKPKLKKVEYFIYVQLGDLEGKTDLEQWTKEGIVKYPVKVYPGQSVMEKIEFRATFKTEKGNPMMISKTYNLAVENRTHYR